MRYMWTVLSMATALLISQNLFAQDFEGNWPDGRFGSGQGNGGSFNRDSDSSSTPRALSPAQAEAERRGEIRRSHMHASDADYKERGVLADKYTRVHGLAQWRSYGESLTLGELRQEMAAYPAALYPDPKLTQHGAPPYSYVTSDENKKRLAEINANRGEFEALRQRYIKARGFERWANFGGYMTLAELRNVAKYFSVAAVVAGALGLSSEAQSATVRFDPESSAETPAPVSLGGSNVGTVGTRNSVLSPIESQTGDKRSNGSSTLR